MSRIISIQKNSVFQIFQESYQEVPNFHDEKRAIFEFLVKTMSLFKIILAQS